MLAFTLVSIISGALGFWFIFIYCARFVVKKKNKYKNSNPKNKFAVLIAARNEENVIGNLIKSLWEQNYPNDLFNVYTLINNTTDNTEFVAKKEGSEIIICPSNTLNKASALRYAFNILDDSEKKYDAYVIIDADNVVDKNLLRNINNCLNEGYRVGQCYRAVKNRETSLQARGISVFYDMINDFLNESHYRLGMSCSLNGTGVVIASSLIKEIGFDMKTLTEDVEFSCMCAIHNEPIAFIPNAITKDEQTDSIIDSLSQRRRWMTGFYQCLYYYGFKLLTTATLQSIDLLLYLIGLFTLFIPFLIIPGRLLIYSLKPGQGYDIRYFELMCAVIPIVYILEAISTVIVLYVHNRRLKFSDLITILFMPIYIFISRIVSLFAFLFPAKMHEYIKHTGVVVKNKKRH